MSNDKARQEQGRQVNALIDLITDIYGAEKLVLKAGKLEALALIRSKNLQQRVLGLQRLIFENPTLKNPPSKEKIPQALEELEEVMADFLARRSLEESIERKVKEKMEERHEEYLQEIKRQVMRDCGSVENPQTLRKYAKIEKMFAHELSRSALELLRPATLEEIVGQTRAVRSLVSKLASPHPPHILLYGPPGVGKTTAARLALSAVQKIAHAAFAENAPFVEVDGTTLRWDPREATNPLLGSVHDPIYQGARKDLAEGGVPEPKPGLVTEAHGGVLFIDEIGEMDVHLQSKLLKVLEDKRVIFESAYYDPQDPQVPKYIKLLFEQGAPADFVLIGATTRSPEELSPALRSRCAAVYFDPLTPKDIERIVHNAAAKLEVRIENNVARLISLYTNEGRQAVNLLVDAYGRALYDCRQRKQKKPVIREKLMQEVLRDNRLFPLNLSYSSSSCAVGKVFALGVYGFTGSVLEIEALAFPSAAPGKGKMRYNETAGSMTRDSVFVAATVIRKLTGVDIQDYDLHINVVGGGNINGPSAGAAIFIALLSAVKGIPVKQDCAITGELSLQGTLKAVGGLTEKIYGACLAGIRKVLVPAENKFVDTVGFPGMEILSVEEITEILPHFFGEEAAAELLKERGDKE